jgi:hypothetical protein
MVHLFPFFSPLTGTIKLLFLFHWVVNHLPESTGKSISILTGPPSPLTEIIPSSDQPSVVDISSPISFLPRWDAKMIEVVGPDVGDISSGSTNS